MAYITVTEAKAYIGGISGSGDDALLADLIDSSEAFIERYTDLDFKVAADSTNYYTVGRDTEGRYLWFDTVFASLTEVLNGDSAQTEITSSQYTTIPKNRTPYIGIKILGSAAKVWEYNNDPEDAITVTGRRGWSTTPPADILQACRDIVKQVYRSRDANAETTILAGGVVITPNNIPRQTQVTLDAYRLR